MRELTDEASLGLRMGRAGLCVGHPDVIMMCTGCVRPLAW